MCLLKVTSMVGPLHLVGSEVPKRRLLLALDAHLAVYAVAASGPVTWLVLHLVGSRVEHLYLVRFIVEGLLLVLGVAVIVVETNRLPSMRARPMLRVPRRRVGVNGSFGDVLVASIDAKGVRVDVRARAGARGSRVFAACAIAAAKAGWCRGGWG